MNKYQYLEHAKCPLCRYPILEPSSFLMTQQVDIMIEIIKTLKKFVPAVTVDKYETFVETLQSEIEMRCRE